MPTIKDIAIKAGVSHGTVSNVLNKRGNVSVEKINLVEKAARELGFKLNTQAKQLRQGHTNRVCVLIPGLDTEKYRDLFNGIEHTLKDKGYEVDVYCSNNLKHDEEALLERAASSNPAAVVVVSSFLKNSGIFSEDTRFIFVERSVKNMPSNSVYVSFDFRRAGMELAQRCVDDGHKNIAIFCGDQRFSDNRSFLSGLKEILEQNDQECPVFAADHMMGMNVAFDILSSPNHFDAIITDCMEHADFFRIASEYDPPQHPPQLYSLASKEMIPGKQVVQYAFNYKLCGKTIADYIVKSENGEIIPTDFLKLPNDGFYHFGAQQTTASEKINILMLSCPTSKALKSLLPAFTKSTGIQVKLMEVSYDELYTSAADSKESQAYDLIRLDMAWLSELGKKLFLPLNMEEEPFKTIQNGFSANLPFDYYDVENTVYSLPFDPSVQILYYRKDLFEDALVKREFYERFKRQLTVPKTFEEYNEVAGFFTQKYNPNSPTKYGTTLVFGSSIVAACDYLPRLKELGGVSISESGHVDLHTPAVKKALENYLQTYDYTDRVTQVWWQQAAELFAEGNVAMNILFANHASIMIQNHDSKVLGKIGFAAVPGGHPLLGGGVIGISKNTRKQEACKKFLHWIYSEQVASGITYLGGYINHRNLLNYVDLLELYPWIEGMEKAFGIGYRREDMRRGSFDEFKFEKLIGVAIRSAVSGVLSVEEALDEAQQRCNEVFSESL